MTRRALPVLLAAAALFSLTACASAGASAEQPDPTADAPSVSVTPTPTPHPTARLFDGECDDVLSTEEISTTTGLAVTLLDTTPLENVQGGEAAVASLGGFGAAGARRIGRRS